MNHGTRAGKGCNKGSKCTDFHPKMCPLSISKGECFDLSCTLCHVKGTKRRLTKPDKPDKVNGENSTQNTASPPNKSPPSEPTAKIESIDTLPTDERSFNDSFLVQINLLRKELQEAMDKKLETLITMQSPQMFQQTPPAMPMRPPTNPVLQQFAPIPWMHPLYQSLRNPLLPMGY